jgi:hypothetical protein
MPEYIAIEIGMQISENLHIECRKICGMVVGSKWRRSSHSNKRYLSIHNIFAAQISHHQVILKELRKS